EHCVANQSSVGTVINARHRRIYIEVNDSGVAWYRVAPALSGYRTGPAADKKHQIGIIDYTARLRGAAIRTDDSGGERVLFVDGTLAADGRGDRDRELLS